MTRPSRAKASGLRPMGPYPVEQDGVSVRIPVRSDAGWAWARIDSIDLARVLAHRWRLRDGYVLTTVWDSTARKGIHVMLHRMITNAPAGVLVDHRWHDTLDCRRCALRFATHSQNSANARRPRRHSSRFRGVTKHAYGWQAQIRHQGRNHYLGLFKTEREAAQAYNRAARRFHRAFAILNRLPRRHSVRRNHSGERAA